MHGITEYKQQLGKRCLLSQLFYSYNYDVANNLSSHVIGT